MISVRLIALILFNLANAEAVRINTRANALKHINRSIYGIFVVGFIASSSFLGPANALAKRFDLSPSDIATIVADDIVKNQALVTADFTRDIYDESCTFQDEISTYEINEYVKGTKALFDPALSHVDLVGPVTATNDLVEFKFSETLAFKIPFNPKVKLTGHVELNRGKNGLITKSREHWDTFRL